MAALLSYHETVNRVVLIPIDVIDPNPMQPRRHFDEQQIHELAQSIKQNGLLQPIIVRRAPKPGRYELIAGHRRLLATGLLGESQIGAIVEEMDDHTCAVMAVVENLQRQDLSCFEEAEGIAALIELLGMSQQQAALRLGKAQSTIANKLRLLKLPQEAREAIARHGLTERHARALLPLAGSSELVATIHKIARQKLKVEATERLVERMLAKQGENHGRTIILRDVRLFVNTVNKAVAIMREAGVNVTSKRRESDEFIEYTILIPKAEPAGTKGPAKTDGARPETA